MLVILKLIVTVMLTGSCVLESNIDSFMCICTCVSREKEELLVWMDDQVRMGNLDRLELLDYGLDQSVSPFPLHQHTFKKCLT